MCEFFLNGCKGKWWNDELTEVFYRCKRLRNRLCAPVLCGKRTPPTCEGTNSVWLRRSNATGSSPMEFVSSVFRSALWSCLWNNKPYQCNSYMFEKNQLLTPSDRPFRRTDVVVYRYLFVLLSLFILRFLICVQCSEIIEKIRVMFVWNNMVTIKYILFVGNVPNGCQSSVYYIICRHHVRMIFTLSVNRAQQSQGSAHKNTSGTVKIINPPRDWLFHRTDN